MPTLGIDLSAQPRATASCIVEWHTGGARIAHLDAGYDNEALVALVSKWQPSKVAIDAPFGWPMPFTQAIAGFTEAGRWPESDDRRPLLFRHTDLVVRELTGADPLSVSSDRLAICAMRCARLLTLLVGSAPLDRTGGRLVAEVYPAASLRQWQLDPRGYKGPKPEKVAKRAELVAALAASTTSWLELDSVLLEALRASDHLLDALLAALLARAVERAQTLPLEPDDLEVAKAEGWIHLPPAQPLGEFNPAA